jgi:manganese efflux pump family protein
VLIYKEYMIVFKLLVLGLVIGSNNLAAALALGALGQASRRLRVVLVFGLYEFFVPLIGVGLGRTAARWVNANAAWVGSALLMTLGLFTLAAGYRNRSEDVRIARLATSWRGLMLLAAGLSADNLVVGFSLGLDGLSALWVALTIAVFSMAFTWVGIGLGGEMRRHWERRAKLGAGVLLICLGIASAVGWV